MVNGYCAHRTAIFSEKCAEFFIVNVYFYILSVHNLYEGDEGATGKRAKAEAYYCYYV